MRLPFGTARSLVVNIREKIEQETSAFYAALQKLGWKNEGTDRDPAFMFTIRGGYRGTVNPEGFRRLRASLRSGLMTAFHGEKILVNIPFHMSATPEQHALTFHQAVTALDKDR